MPGRSFLTQVLPLAGALYAASAGAQAQTVIRGNERLDTDRPETWAMNYFTASSFMTGFGATPALRPGQWTAAVEVGHIPHLSDAQQQVGFGGFKQEDLNKSPVIGRLRGLLGLPGGWVAELGYTPPVEIDGARPRALVAAAIGRLLLERGDFSLSARLFGQHGSVSGDITCPAELAGIEDEERNPYGCHAPSDDRLRLNHYGIELTAGVHRDAWRWHAGVSSLRSEPQVQVDAYTYGVHDRSRLVAKDVVPTIALGATRAYGQHWRWGVEVFYVPLRVRRGDGRSSDNDPLTSVRLHLRYEAN